ncbi:MAG: hypothetical protein ACTHL1_04320 [Burkholderiaceae bacterium]
MRQTSEKLKRRLFAPAVYAVAFLLLFEDWLWDRAVRLLAAMPALPWQAALEKRIAALSPYPAVALFALPGLLLFPVKILAVVMIATGHPLSGLALIAAAKIGGTLLVAWIYRLVRPRLLALAWFARLYAWTIAWKDRTIARLRATPAWWASRRAFRLIARRIRQALRAHPRQRAITLFRRLRRKASRTREDADR